jgi:hypothetical protein
MTLGQYFFLALRTVVLFFIELVALFFCMDIEGEARGLSIVALVGFICIAPLEYSLSRKRGVTQENAIIQTGVIMSVFILFYVTVILLDLSLSST